MSMNSLEIAFKLIDENFSKDETLFYGAVDEELISNAEKILNIKFPNSYRVFIQKKGFGGVNSVLIPGIRVTNTSELPSTGVVWEVITDREALKYPNHLLRLYDVGEGTTYCLDTSQMNEKGECPVVVWPIGGYEMTPKLEVIADDFGAFFLDMVKKQIEYKKEEEENN